MRCLHPQLPYCLWVLISRSKVKWIDLPKPDADVPPLGLSSNIACFHSSKTRTIRNHPQRSTRLPLFTFLMPSPTFPLNISGCICTLLRLLLKLTGGIGDDEIVHSNDLFFALISFQCHLIGLTWSAQSVDESQRLLNSTMSGIMHLSNHWIDKIFRVTRHLPTWIFRIN